MKGVSCDCNVENDIKFTKFSSLLQMFLNESNGQLEALQVQHEKHLDSMEKELKAAIETMDEDETNLSIEIYDLNIRKQKLDEMNLKYI